ncbi:unnamed protein product [Chilo suppressalis]|uniref:Ribosomal RNA processing protein 1 homolog n=1 Tax=Chilo suppressalis TaxID=168631 RepID=A0ABN8B6W3_CHISP|nr:unnamed protein product [Chilo suppressalis]
MSDKPLVQEELCETIAGILDLFPNEQIKCALMMTKAGFKVLATEWYGIDQHRMDKFLMLVRRYLRGSLRCLQRAEWSLKSCQMYADMLSSADGLLAVKTPLYARNAGSMLLHFVDCFLEELSKVSSGNIPGLSLVTLLRPFCLYMCKGESTPVCVSARRVLTALLRQSEHGLMYQEKTKAWERMGCPQGGPDALELESDEEGGDEQQPDDDNEEDNDKAVALDPRAGRVDVVLTPLPVPASEIAQMLRELLSTASSKAHKRTKICLQRFEQLSRDEYPLVVPDILTDEDGTPKPRTIHAATDLHTMERDLVQSADELALRGLSRRHRKRLLAKSRAGLSIVEDVEAVKGTCDSSTNGNWDVESTVPAKKSKNNSSNKENVNKDKKSKKRKHADAKTDANNKKHKSAHQEEKEKQTEETKEETAKKSYEKKTKSRKNKNKKQILPNSVQDVNLISKLNASKEDTKAKLINKQNKNKNIKAETSEKKTDKNLEKIQTPQKNQTKNDKVLGKSNKINSDVKKQDQRQQKSPESKKQEKKTPSLLVNKVKNYQKRTNDKVTQQKKFETPKKVKFVLKNNCMQGPVDYYKSVRQSPNIPFDSSKQPSKTNLKVSTPSPINPFFKKKLRIK